MQHGFLANMTQMAVRMGMTRQAMRAGMKGVDMSADNIKGAVEKNGVPKGQTYRTASPEEKVQRAAQLSAAQNYMQAERARVAEKVSTRAAGQIHADEVRGEEAAAEAVRNSRAAAAKERRVPETPAPEPEQASDEMEMD